MFRRLGCAAIIAAGVGAGFSADADSNLLPATPAAAPTCSEAAIIDVLLPRDERVDEIRVVVASSSPERGAAKINVAAGEFDRTLYIRGGSHGLSFSTPLHGEQFQVTLDPVLSAPSAACIERIELRGDGHLVAAIKI